MYILNYTNLFLNSILKNLINNIIGKNYSIMFMLLHSAFKMLGTTLIPRTAGSGFGSMRIGRVPGYAHPYIL